MWWDDIGILVNYAAKRYPELNVKWKDLKFELRSYEIYAYETAISMCMDNIWTEPIDILDDYLMYLEHCIVIFKGHKKREKQYKTMRAVIISLRNQLINKN